MLTESSESQRITYITIVTFIKNLAGIGKSVKKVDWWFLGLGQMGGSDC